MVVDLLSRYAVGGATRPDSFSGLQPDFASSLAQLFQAAPPEVQAQLRIMSGFRSPERQAQLWENALKKYGSPEAARKWVAPPGRSRHNMGSAVDLRYLDDAAREWAHANAGNFGLHFPMKHEPWHIEPVGSRGGNRGMANLVSGERSPAPAPSLAEAVASQQPAPPQAAGTPAPALGPARTISDAPIAAQQQAAPAMAFGDLIAPRPAPNFAAIVQQMAERRKEQEAEEQQRRMLLLAGLGDLYG